MVLCRRAGANTDIASNILVTEPVSLKLSWNVACLLEDSTDIFLSNLDAHWFVLMLYECFRKLDWSERLCARIVHTVRTLGGLRCPAVIVNQKWCGQSKIAGGAARWTAVELGCQLTFISVLLHHKGKKLGEFEAVLMELQEFVSGRPKQQVIFGGDFNTSFVPHDRLFPRGGADSKTKNAVGHKRRTESESFTHDGDRT